MQVDGIRPRQGRGQVQWNFGGWFGSVLGCSLWIVLAAAFVASHEAWEPAAVLAACAAVVLGTGVVLWRRRGRIAPLRGTLTLLAASCVAAVVSLTTLDAIPDAVPEMAGLPDVPGWTLTGPAALFGGLAILMVVVDRRGRTGD